MSSASKKVRVVSPTNDATSHFKPSIEAAGRESSVPFMIFAAFLGVLFAAATLVWAVVSLAGMLA
jgi:hypothetical protein